MNAGGRFQRQLSIRYRNGDYRFDMRQRFQGAYFKDNELYVNAVGNCVGSLPASPIGELMRLDNVDTTWIREAPGRCCCW